MKIALIDDAGNVHVLVERLTGEGGAGALRQAPEVEGGEAGCWDAEGLVNDVLVTVAQIRKREEQDRQDMARARKVTADLNAAHAQRRK